MFRSLVSRVVTLGRSDSVRAIVPSAVVPVFNLLESLSRHLDAVPPFVEGRWGVDTSRRAAFIQGVPVPLAAFYQELRAGNSGGEYYRPSAITAVMHGNVPHLYIGCVAVLYPEVSRTEDIYILVTDVYGAANADGGIAVGVWCFGQVDIDEVCANMSLLDEREVVVSNYTFEIRVQSLKTIVAGRHSHLDTKFESDVHFSRWIDTNNRHIHELVLAGTERGSVAYSSGLKAHGLTFSLVSGAVRGQAIVYGLFMV